MLGRLLFEVNELDKWRTMLYILGPKNCGKSELGLGPAEADPEGLPGAGRLQLGSETAARTCQRAASGLPAAAALRPLYSRRFLSE
eukprot:COSAG06_NODE_5168_length_3665_cov_2.995794_4_plen_86_part_00